MRTRLKKLTFISSTLALYCCATTPTMSEDQLLAPEPIPPGYDFPADRNLLQDIADRRDVKAAREHAWQVWLGMNQNSRVKASGDVASQYLPIWETWYSEEEITTGKIITKGPNKGQSEGILKPITPEEVIRQREYVSRGGVKPRQSHHLTADVVVTFNKFNPTAGEFIMGPKYHDGKVYHYNVKGDLKALNASFSADTNVAQRTIQPFPPRAMETKPVFMLVKKSGLTAIPFWQGPLASTDTTEPTPGTWTACALIDPSKANRDLSLRLVPPVNLSADPSKGKNPDIHTLLASADKSQVEGCTSPIYAGLNQIYHYQLMTDADAAAFNNEQGGNAEKGDYAVLMAMHINTKEITNWTWQTFFWTGGESPPNDYPGDTSNQPVALKSPWDKYSMCTAYWQEDNDGDVKVCFNPFLETSTSGIPDGLNSNCMSCHGTARTAPLYNSTSAAPIYPQNYNRGIGVGPEYFSEQYFRMGEKGNTRTDFSWALGTIPQ